MTFKDIAEDVEPRFDTSNYEINMPLPKGRKKVINSMKNKLRRKIIKRVFCFKSKVYSYLTNNMDKDKKVKGTKIFIIKPKLKLGN